MGKQKAEQWSLAVLEKPLFVASGQQWAAEPVAGDVLYNSQHVFFALATTLTRSALGTPFPELLFPPDYYRCQVAWYSETCLHSQRTADRFSLETQARADSWTWLKG